MTPGFLAIAAGMLTVALLLIFTPLWRTNYSTRRRLRAGRAELRALEEAHSAGDLGPADYASRRADLAEGLLSIFDDGPKRGRAALFIGLAVAVLVPLAVLGMYRWWGSPQTLGASAAVSGDTAMPMLDHGTDMQAAIAKLADKLREHPDDAEGWALLGRTYKATQHYTEARDALRRAVEAAPQDADLAREYAAAETPVAETAVDVAETPVDAEAARNSAPVAESGGISQNNQVPPTGLETVSGASKRSAQVVVKVALDPKFKDNVRPNDTLFVFAKAARGPPMPLAIARLTAAQLPTIVTLTDAMAMVPSMTLSRFSQIVVGARISKSGNAIAERGDLQTVSATTSAQAEPVQLIIAERVN